MTSKPDIKPTILGLPGNRQRAARGFGGLESELLCKIWWRSDAITILGLSEKRQRASRDFRGLESELVEGVHVPSRVARSWAWCSPARTFSGSKQRPRAVGAR